ncbi:MAG: hypothetical protein PPHEMADE_5642 [uncultured Paraburkholderia sp.]|nr:MAG: hypothetical protein PPHEMADE_5642 [uncultured Paraburkholderia sp.]
MSRHGVKTACQKGCMRAHAQRGSRGEPTIQREIARASLLNIASVVMTGAFQQPARNQDSIDTCAVFHLPRRRWTCRIKSY